MKKKLLFLWSFSLFLLWNLSASAQSENSMVTVNGIVQNTKQEPISSATIIIMGAKRGTITDENGHFSISIKRGSILNVSALNYLKQEIKITDNTPKSIMVTLNDADNDMTDVVVTGYRTTNVSSLTGAVSVIDGKKFENATVANLGDALQGKAAGVQITAQNGAPGSNAFIRIRGISSFGAGSDPLLVVDGVIVPTNTYNSINPNDIAAVSVLKDASATAIYGSRGANGVIVIATKKGQVGAPVVQFHSEYGQESRLKDNFKLMNASQKLQYEYDLGYTNPYIQSAFPDFFSNNPNATVQDLPKDSLNKIWGELETSGSNWFDALFQNAPWRKNEISISGADDKFNYFFSLNNLSQQGILRNSNYKNTGGRLNMEYKPYNWLKVGTQLSFNSYQYTSVFDIYNGENPTVAAYTINPYEPVYDPSQKWGANPYGDGYNVNGTLNGLNIIAYMKQDPNNTRYNYGFGNGYITINPIKDLTITSKIGVNFTDYLNESYLAPGGELDILLNSTPTGSKSDAGQQIFNYDWVNTANYTHSFNNQHNLSVLVGEEFTKEHSFSYSLGSKGFPSPDLTTQENAASPTTTTTSKYDWTVYSLFANPTYNFEEKYYVDASLRRDGSSRFGSDTKYGTFYSVGLGWDLAKESFIKADWLNMLKIRSSYGSTGNYNIGNYQSLDLFSFKGYAGNSAAYPYQIGNPDLTWEKRLKFNIGVDFKLFDKLSGSVNWFNENTEDILQSLPIPRTTGFTGIEQNIGSMNNKGWEITIDQFDIYNKRDFYIGVSGNVTFLKNKITKLGGGQNLITDPNTNGYTAYKVGQPYNVYYMTRYAGVDPSNGDALYLDTSGQKTNDYATNYSVVLNGKSPAPTYFGSVTPSVGYKGLSLSAMFYFSGGNYIYNNQWESLEGGDGYFVGQELSTAAFNYWKKPGDVNVLPKPTNGNPELRDPSTRWLQKGDFVRLRDITLKYEFPKEILQQTKIVKDFSIYITGHNLFTWTKYKGDPEVGIGSSESDPNSNGVYSLYSYPNYRSWTVGLDVNF